ncbi:MAG: cyclic nucleotide-binding domain-containing protein [Dehalococcoidia bacterium]|nr:cyclic nucleotide-binding domain-containing protein [Dehalococcoidia bacterium]
MATDEPTTDRPVTSADLAASGLFADLPSQSLAPLVGVARRRRLEPGEILFAHGEPAESCFVVERGRVVLRATAGGRSTIVMSAGPGDLLGWSALRPEARWLTTARAVDAVTVIAIPIAALLDFLAGGSEERRILISRLAAIAADHLEATQSQLIAGRGEGLITGG